ncbi:MAG TPA: OmpH family outer membrane protein [Candidatus Aerophobetes bacterium]|uniref:OmpH family outer membrane protein n=1 Tax=Aerophobetes bacterium TaxID=2030807 RepID=A0A7C1RKE3_UNCAE|nr:OmpH family outer membrane protein [Candidatus Aerophobetes bacterium]
MRRKKNKSLILLLICLSFMVGLSVNTARADLVVNIGYVDLERIFQGYEKTKEFEAKLKMENEADQKMLIERRQIIEKEIDKLRGELETQALMLSESAREEKQTEIERRAEELDEFSAYIERRMIDREAKYTDGILRDLGTKVPSIIESIAEKEGYRFVFDRRSLFYVTPEKEFDLTDKVIAQLNEQYKAETESGE